MAKKRSHHSHGHYCKICGEYKANENFSGKGHTAHICKACSRLSAAEKAEAMTINRLENLALNRLSDSDRAWLENRIHDSRPEVAELAKEIYALHFPYAERNKRKKQLVINTLDFELHTEVFDEYGDEVPVNMRFTADRISRILTMTDFDADGAEQTITLDGGAMSKLLRWTVHSLEIFMWAEDYNLDPSRNSIPPYFDLLPEYWPDEAWMDDEDDELDGDLSDEELPEREIRWRVKIEYSDHTKQEIVSYQDYLTDNPEELYLALLEYFTPETDEYDEEYDDETLSE